jgi:simple sugar transport system permease protein
MGDVVTTAFVISVLASAVRIATPLLFGALGELVSESAGILNLSIEGTMTVGAFSAFAVVSETGNLWLGLFAAILTGAVTGFLFAFITATVKVNQIVAGLAFNLLTIGVSFYLFRSILTGITSSTDVPNIDTFGAVHIPGLSDVPWIGDIFFSQQGLTYLGLLMVLVVWFVLKKTRFGLELRSVGHNPEACDMRGINVAFKQYMAVIFGGIMSAVGGAFLTIASTGLWFPEVAAGRGWIALALVILGNWRASWILYGALFYGFLDALQLALQANDVNAPYQLLLALPFLLTIIALVLNRARSGEPLSLAVPYHRGER